MKSKLHWNFVGAVLAYSVACKVLPYMLHALNTAGFPIDPQQTWYPWNFSPYWAVFAFCGAIIPARRWAIAIPLLMMLVSDMLIYLVYGNQFETSTDWMVQAWVYASFAICGLMGMVIRNQPNLFRGIGASLPGAILFYITTNYAMWAYGEGQFYPQSVDGLWASYVAGLPFLRTSLISTTVYAGLFFSPWGLGLAGVSPQHAGLMIEPAVERVRG